MSISMISECSGKDEEFKLSGCDGSHGSAFPSFASGKKDI